jgi:hypothetical protein
VSLRAFLSEAIPAGVAFENKEIASAKSASQETLLLLSCSKHLPLHQYSASTRKIPGGMTFRWCVSVRKNGLLGQVSLAMTAVLTIDNYIRFSDKLKPEALAGSTRIKNSR